MRFSAFRPAALMILLALAIAFLGARGKPFNYVPPKGYVPDAETAVRVGRAVLVPVYGEKTIAREEPLTATLNGEVWTILGSMHVPNGPRISGDGRRLNLIVGGVAEVHISRRTGAILRMLHGK